MAVPSQPTRHQKDPDHVTLLGDGCSMEPRATTTIHHLAAGGGDLARTFEAVVFGWSGTAVADRHADASAVRSRVEALCAAGVHVILVSDTIASEVDGQLRARPPGPGRLLLCVNAGFEVVEVTRIGATVWNRTAGRACDAAAGGPDPLGRAVAWLAGRGITGGLVLVVGHEFGRPGDLPGRDAVTLGPGLERATVVAIGAEPGGAPEGVLHLPGGPTRFIEILDEQLRRRRQRRVPHIDDDPAWVVRLPDGPTHERVAEAIGALGNGHAGLRASREENGARAGPLFAINGIYTNEDLPRLLEGPIWTNLALDGAGPGGRRLDLRTGVLARDDHQTGLRTLRFLSAARPEVLGLRAEGPPARLGADGPFAANAATALERAHRGRAELARTSTPGGGGIVVAVHDRDRTTGDLHTVERVGVWAADPTRPPGWDEPTRAVGAAVELGFDRLLAEQREAWAERWADAAVSIEGDGDDQLAARFAVFHLLNAAPETGEAAVGPRGLTGQAYGGHVFWDADVYVLPALAAIRPGAARAMLEYRLRRLPAARRTAARLRLSGARVPWESARDGTDVTPRHVVGLHGERIPVRTGEQQEHIVADVAWAASEYAAWTGDAAFLAGPGRDLLVDTARYWASRVRRDRQGRAHLYGVMGPDEYHEAVDDSVYTNVMARWNLRRAARLVEEEGGDPEAAAWAALSERLVVRWDPRRGLHEQFEGYWDLEPLLAENVARRPFAADLLLGRERVEGSQLIKQADVVMLHHLVPDEMRPGSRRSDVAYYEPRTTHGSSLSPAIHAAVLARAGHLDRALDAFRLAARLDLDDLTGTTASGLHLATMGGLWQALAYGFLGLRPRPDHLAVDPRLPAAWQALALRFRFHGAPVGARAEQGALHVTCEKPVAVRVGGGQVEPCPPPGRTFVLDSRHERRSR